MGKKHNGSLSYQISERMKDLNRIGQSKYEAQQKEKAAAKSEGRRYNPAKVDGIYGIKTMEHYVKIGNRWANWAKTNVPEIIKGRTLGECREAAAAYIKDREAKGHSRWTLAQDRSALAKLMAIPGDNICSLPPRKLIDRIKNEKMPKGFSEKRNRDLVAICKATGLRKREIKALIGKHLGAKDGRLILHNVIGKGGKKRDVTIPRSEEALVRRLFEGKAQDEKIIERVPNRTPCHIYRREYVAKRNEELRKEGLKLHTQRDKIITKDLGHNRTSVMANYR